MKYTLLRGGGGHYEIFPLSTSGLTPHSQLEAPQLGKWDLSVSK
jgi:hypothetical protein